LSKQGAFDQSFIGKILCVGDYENAEEIKEDNSKECVFGKIESIKKNIDGTLTLILVYPTLTELYDKLEIYSKEDLVFNENSLPETFELDLKNAFLASDGFAEFLTASSMAAESYALEHRYSANTAKDSSFWDRLKLRVTYEFDDENTKLIATIKGEFSIDLEIETGIKVGSFVVDFETGVTFDFSEGTVAITVGDVISTPLFTNHNGWISIPEDIEMCWLKQGSNYNLYYPVFVTERETVEAAGKSLATDSIDLVSSKFLLVR
jgi:hypothetical protein